MTEEKKDLTGLLQYSQALQESGQAPPVPEGAVMEEQPIEKIDSFESLEDFAHSNPPPEPPSEPTPESPPEQAPEPAPNLEAQFESAPSSEPIPDFNVTPPDPVSESPPTPPATVSESPSDFPVTENNADPFQTTPAESNPVQADFNPSDFPVNNDIGETALEPPPSDLAERVETPIEAPELPIPPPPVKSPAKPTTPQGPLEKVKKFSENLPVGKPAVPAAFPFSLLIHGNLMPEEKERLLDLISRENMGIREIDLEPQFQSGKILIPRISEYAGVLLIQALRGARAQIKLAPSDLIFSTNETKSEGQEGLSDEMEDHISTFSSDTSHPAEQIPVTADDKLPNFPHFEVIDTLAASATLKSGVVEAETSAEYNELIDALAREIKYKAYRRGATGVTHFKVQLSTLSSPTHYRIMVLGTAIRPNRM